MNENPIYRVTIENTDEEDGCPLVVGRNGELVWALFYAIRAIAVPRLEKLVAELLENFSDCNEFGNIGHFPGHMEAVDRMVGAAKEIVSGWKKKDKRTQELLRDARQ